MTEIKLYKKPLKGLKILALTIPFVAIGIWMITEKQIGSSDYIMAWLCTCFFGLGLPVGLFHTFDRRPQIIINESGIWDRTTKQTVIEWKQIESAYPLEVYKQKFVCLVLYDTFEIKKKLYKWAKKINEDMDAQNVNLLMSQLKIDELTMTNFINEMCKADRQNRIVIIKKLKFRS